MNELHKTAKGNIAVAVELTKGPIVYALQKYSFVTVFPIHGLTLARYRQAMFPSGAKEQYYPQPLEWFCHRDTELFCDFLIKWPALHTVKHATTTSIVKCFQARCLAI